MSEKNIGRIYRSIVLLGGLAAMMLLPASTAFGQEPGIVGVLVEFPGGEHYDLANCITWGIEGYQVQGHNTQSDIVVAMVDRVAAACQRLDLSPEAVLGHKEIDLSRRSDPVGVDMDEFRAQVQRTLWWMEHAPLPSRYL